MGVSFLKKEQGKNTAWKRGSIKSGALPLLQPVAPLVYSEVVQTSPKATFNLPWQIEYDFRSGEMLGSVAVFINGKIQHRNVPQTGTGVPGVSGTHQYSEIETGIGVTNIVQFNTVLPVGTEVVFVGFFAPYDISRVDSAQIAANTADIAAIDAAIPSEVTANSISNGSDICTIIHPTGVNRVLNITIYKWDGLDWLKVDSEVQVKTNGSLSQTTVVNLSAGTTNFKVVWV